MNALSLLVAAVLGLGQIPGSNTHVLVVSGIGGDREHSDRFYEWAMTFINAAQDRMGVPEDLITYLAEKRDRDPAHIDGRSTKVEIETALAAIAERAAPTDVVFVMLAGHGSTRGDDVMFNVPGPDLTATDFAAALSPFSTQRLVFVNLSTASGGFVPVLSGPNRIVITATKSGFERNESIFGGFFVQAFAEDVADTDKDDRVSILEAFEFARREVARVYDAEQRLLTEHALLDDNGDGEGSTEPDAREADGAIARTIFLAGGGAAVAAAAGDDPVLAALLEEKRQIEQRIAELRNRKDQMDPQEYENSLEDLIVELALKNREIEARNP